MNKEELKREFENLEPKTGMFGRLRPVSEEINFKYRDAIFDWLYSLLSSRDKEIEQLPYLLNWKKEAEIELIKVAQAASILSEENDRLKKEIEELRENLKVLLGAPSTEQK